MDEREREEVKSERKRGRGSTKGHKRNGEDEQGNEWGERERK